MAQPPRYERDFDFTDWGQSRPDEPVPGDRVDSELDNIELTLDGLLDNLALLQRDDGELANETVGDDQLKPEVIAKLGQPGPEGPAGPVTPGPAGIGGPKGDPLPWLVVSSIPPSTVGVIEQLALNQSNGDVYQKLSNGWQLVANLRGPPGSGGGTGVSDHGALTGLADPDHPISAVAGLQTALDGIQAALVGVQAAQLNVYRQPGAPTTNLNAGDLWFDSDAGDRLYRWDGASWVDVADARIAQASSDAAAAISAAAGAQATADGKVTTYYATTAPAGADVGDLWFNTASGNRLSRWSGSAWVLVQDAGITQAISAAQSAQSTADGKIVTYYQAAAPSAGVSRVGDLWFDTDDGNKAYRYSGAAWVSVQDATISAAAAAAASAVNAAATAQATADGKIVTFYQSSAPGTASIGDLWIRTTDNQLHRRGSSGWVAVQDIGIQNALSSAALAQASADGKIVTFYATTPPVAEGTGDLWFDTDDQMRPYRWNGGNWVDVTPIAGVVAGQVGALGIQAGASLGTYVATKSSSTNIAVIEANKALIFNDGALEFTTSQALDGTVGQKVIVLVDLHYQATWVGNEAFSVVPFGPAMKFSADLYNQTAAAVVQTVTVPGGASVNFRTLNHLAAFTPYDDSLSYSPLSFSAYLTFTPPATPSVYRVRLHGWTPTDTADINALSIVRATMTVLRVRR